MDDFHDLLEELDGWLADRRTYSRKQVRRDDWQSIIDDVAVAWGHAGPASRAAAPTMDDILPRLHAELGLDQAERNALRVLVERTRSELRAPDLAAHAFDDLVAAVTDTTTSTNLIAARLDLIDSVLRFSGRSLRQVSGILSGILDDDATAIAVAQDELRPTAATGPGSDAASPASRNSADPDSAGLTDTERLELGRQWVTHEPAPADHVVWLFYGGARLDYWRLRIGTCEFYPGAALMVAMAQRDSAQADEGDAGAGAGYEASLPAELVDPEQYGAFGSDPRNWPAEDHWVAVRVNLGAGRFPDPEEAALAQVEAVLGLASFENDGETSWHRLMGYKMLRDGVEAGYSLPFRKPADRPWRIESDHTQEWLRRISRDVGGHLVTDDRSRVIVHAIAALNAASTASPSVRVLEAVRSVEAQAAAVPGTHWKTLLSTHVLPWNALVEAQTAPFDVLAEAAARFELRGPLPQLHEQTEKLYKSADGPYVALDVKTAHELLVKMQPQLPTHHYTARRAREVVADLATPASTLAFIDRAVARDLRLIERAARVRNALMHGGPVNDGVLETTAQFIVPRAKNLAGITLRALLDGKELGTSARRHTRQVKAHMAGMARAADTSAALYGAPRPEKRAAETE